MKTTEWELQGGLKFKLETPTTVEEYNALAGTRTPDTNTTGIAVLDDGNLSNLVTNLGAAISVGSVVKPGRVVTSSAELDMVGSDYAIGLQRTVAVADQVVKLPPTPQVNQEFRLDDLSGNFAQYPVTWTPPVGHNIAGNANWGCNVNRGSWIAHYYGSNTWGISRCAS